MFWDNVDAVLSPQDKLSGRSACLRRYAGTIPAIQISGRNLNSLFYPLIPARFV